MIWLGGAVVAVGLLCSAFIAGAWFAVQGAHGDLDDLEALSATVEAELLALEAERRRLAGIRRFDDVGPAVAE